MMFRPEGIEQGEPLFDTIFQTPNRSRTFRWLVYLGVPICILAVQVYVSHIHFALIGGNPIPSVQVVLGFALAAILPVDITALRHSAMSIRDEMDANRWDLLRITTMGENGVIYAKHALACAQAWNVTMIVIFLRMLAATAIMAILWEYLVLNRLLSGAYMLVPVLLFLMVVEPYWRLKAVAAVGVSVSVRARDALIVTMLATFYLMGISFAVLGLGAWFGCLFYFLYNTFVFFDIEPLLGGTFLVIGTLVWVTLRTLYQRIENTSLQRVFREVA